MDFLKKLKDVERLLTKQEYTASAKERAITANKNDKWKDEISVDLFTRYPKNIRLRQIAAAN